MKTAVRDKEPAAEVARPEQESAEPSTADHAAPEVGVLAQRYATEESEGAEAETEVDVDVEEPGRQSVMSEGYAVPGEAEEHHAEVVFEADDVYGVFHSKPTKIAAIFVALTTAGVKPKKFAKQKRLYERRCADVARAAKALRAAQRAAKGQPRSDPAHQEVLRARYWLRVRTNTLLGHCRRLHVELWDSFGYALGPYLMPASVLSRDVPFTGTPPLGNYRSGRDPANAIPLVWYKPVAAYPKVRWTHPTTGAKTVVNPFGTFAVSHENTPYVFGVAPANRPAAFLAGGGQRLRKVAHKGDRGWQQWYNKVLVATGVEVESKPGNNTFVPFSPKSYDGDHVRDLGFGGTDTIDNYWPLAPDVNRRAFMGYNAFYKINYLDESSPGVFDKGVAMRLGGMIGKYFYIKGFMPATGTDTYPGESGTSAAGHV